jgi:hypothetical protein
MKHNFQFTQITLWFLLIGLFSCNSARQLEALNTENSSKNTITVIAHSQQVEATEAASGENNGSEAAAESSAEASAASITTNESTTESSVSDAIVNSPITAPEDLAVTEQTKTWEAAAKQGNKAQKFSLAQKLVLKKLAKLTAKANQKSEVTAKKPWHAKMSQALDSNLKFALIFLILSIILGLFSWVLGLIFGLIALVFLLLWVMSL